MSAVKKGMRAVRIVTGAAGGNRPRRRAAARFPGFSVFLGGISMRPAFRPRWKAVKAGGANATACVAAM